MEYIWDYILEHLWESILGLVGVIILAIFGYKKKSKSNSQKITAIGKNINIKQNISDKEPKE